MAFNLFSIKPKTDKPKEDVFAIPIARPAAAKKEEDIPGPEPVAKEAAAQAEAAAKEAPVQEKIPEEAEAPAEEEKPAAETAAAEAPPERKRKARKAKAAEEKDDPAPEDPSSEAYLNAGFKPSSVRLDKAREAFSVNTQDKEWEEKREELEKRADNIRIEPDINLGSVRILLAQCTNLYSDLKREQRTNKTFYSVLTDKAIGLIQRQQQINASGKNAEDRKKNSILSCEQFKLKDKDGTEYNLYDLSMIMQERVDTVNDLLDDVKQKKETLISYLAVLKLENGMVK